MYRIGRNTKHLVSVQEKNYLISIQEKEKHGIGLRERKTWYRFKRKKKHGIGPTGNEGGITAGRGGGGLSSERS